MIPDLRAAEHHLTYGISRLLLPHAMGERAPS